MGVRALVIVLVAACSGGNVTIIDGGLPDVSSGSATDPNEGARSGTRLKLTWVNFTDGTRQWLSFYDAERKEGCYPYSAWTNGKVYCTPDNTGSIVYTDASCTQKIGQIYNDPSCATPPPAYLLEWNYGYCASSPAHLYVRGAKTTVAQYYTRSYDGTCAGPYTDAQDDYYQLGAEISPQSLVEVTTAAATDTGRLGEVFWQSADGMRVPTRLHDTQLQTDCYPETFSDNAQTGICVPTNAWYASDYHDSGCAQPVVGLDHTCAAPGFAEYRPTTACSLDPPHVAQITGAAASSPLFYWSGTACTAETAPTNYVYYGVGADVSAAQVTRVADAVVSHRIQLVHYTTPEGLRYRDYALYDSLKGADCYPTALPDGTIECLPYGGYITTYYRDSACTQPIDLVEVYNEANCTTPDPPTYARKYITPAPGSCAYNVELHQVSTPFSGTVYANYGTCAVYNPGASTLYSIGPAVSVNEFVTATTSIDP
jgi:hypothetical protein